jgi:hypothetical protein
MISLPIAFGAITAICLLFAAATSSRSGFGRPV